jgi:hypothetical protein
VGSEQLLQLGSSSGEGNHNSRPAEGFTVSSLLNSESSGEPQPRNVRPVIHGDRSHTVPLQQDESNTYVYQQPPNEPILWPLEHEQEAMLLQHYIDHVALFVRCIIVEELPTDLTISSLT